eukprot:TRINITY_DN4013_c0_g1_i1.p1 TRINITY_DN4013_c0_g1~~TRINITY_DN4013_c0_g1_i1.p1  ORF type:complete len:91 (+),score=13.38 TRINITY_DN4013_c0_g1_i1:293-565(+)
MNDIQNVEGNGIIARYVRFTPLSRNAGGFHGQKALRVGIYGVPMDNDFEYTSRESKLFEGRVAGTFFTLNHHKNECRGDEILRTIDVQSI